MKIFVFGSTGMLGRYISSYFKNKNYETIDISRKDLDVIDINKNKINSLLNSYHAEINDVVINCIGMIKQRKDVDEIDFIKINSIFPRLLSNTCEKMNLKLIHPTTDCVYSGLKGNYDEDDLHDAIDVYGRSKSLGEPSNCCVIRTSIIGEEINQNRSLIEWVKSNKDKTINGYTNHLWNGITCLEFSKICDKIIKENLFWNGTRHIHTKNTISKYDLVKLISEIFNLNIEVIPIETKEPCYRNIKNTKNNNLVELDYKEQLIELLSFRKILENKNQNK